MKKFISKIKKSCRNFVTGKSGFSLVELIVVIAIMAVMAAVLAPALLGYVERSRAQKDDSAMGEVTNAIKLSLADQNVYDELLPYTVKGNFSCYADGDTSTNTDANKVITKAPDYWYFNDNARLLDEVAYQPAGSMRGVTITLKPNGSAEYILKDGIINQTGDSSTTKGTITGKTLNDAPEVYNRLRSTVGDTIKVSSQTYRNSTYTIFISMGTTGGNQADAQDAIKVYGQYNGTNLPEVMTAAGSASQDKGNAGAEDINGSSPTNKPTVPTEVNFKNTPSDFYGANVWTDGVNTYYSNYSQQYVLNGDTWEPKVWKGLTNFRSLGIWTDGTNIYYNSSAMGDGNTGHYILQGDTWSPITWNIDLFYAGNIWTDGTNTYYSGGTSKHYVLNGNTWEPITWSGKTFPYGQRIWNSKTKAYYSDGSTHYVLNGNTWESISWKGLTSFSNHQIWTDGTNTYCSNYGVHYVLDETTNTWNTKTWDIQGEFDGGSAWTDGSQYYVSSATYDYSNPDSPPVQITHHYILP